jgi:lipopolysaccharide assembly protein A
MASLTRLLKWLLSAAIFFTLFAFALNNPHPVAVNFFFGTQWRAPLVLVVLISLSAGVVLGALAMVPRWWRSHRRSRGVNSVWAQAQADLAQMDAAAFKHGAQPQAHVPVVVDAISSTLPPANPKRRPTNAGASRGL